MSVFYAVRKCLISKFPNSTIYPKTSFHFLLLGHHILVVKFHFCFSIKKNKYHELLRLQVKLETLYTNHTFSLVQYLNRGYCEIFSNLFNKYFIGSLTKLINFCIEVFKPYQRVTQKFQNLHHFVQIYKKWRQVSGSTSKELNASLRENHRTKY